MTSAPAFTGGDLSLRKDLTSLVTVTRERPRRPEASDHLVVRSIVVWDPKQSPTREVDYGEVRTALADLPRRFPGLKEILIDAAAESSSVLPWAREHSRLALLVKAFNASADTNMAIWSTLVARLNAGTLSIPRHERLLSELRGLRAESFSFGSRWRVVDSSRRFHRDVSFALALAVFAAGAARACTSAACLDPECDGLAPFGLMSSSHVAEWYARHPAADDDECEPVNVTPYIETSATAALSTLFSNRGLTSGVAEASVRGALVALATAIDSRDLEAAQVADYRVERLVEVAEPETAMRISVLVRDAEAAILSAHGVEDWIAHGRRTA